MVPVSHRFLQDHPKILQDQPGINLANSDQFDDTCAPQIPTRSPKDLTRPTWD